MVLPLTPAPTGVPWPPTPARACTPSTRLALPLRVWLSAAPATPGVGSASSQISTAPLPEATWRPTRVRAWLRAGLAGSGFQIMELTVLKVPDTLIMATRRSVPAGRLKLIEPDVAATEPKLLTAPPRRLTGTRLDGVALRSLDPGPVPTALTAATW